MLSSVKDLSIYLGNGCNFDCSYCDRGYIKKLGGQSIRLSETDSVASLIRRLRDDGCLPHMLSFHGGEPFFYVKRMTDILRKVGPLPGTLVFIQTNGSLLTKNEAFFEEFSNLDILVSISYDFLFQSQSRTELDLMSALLMLKKFGRRVQLQYVMPVQDPKCFSFEVLREILMYTGQGLVQSLDLIPLRHLRGADKFRVVLEEVDLPSLSIALTRFIEMLYVHKVRTVIDGHGMGIQKQYFDNHKQLVVAPGGKLYPEYDFLEYKMDNAVVGTWSETGIEMFDVDVSKLVHESCTRCTQSKTCGLQYLYKEFDALPNEKVCKEFYRRLDLIIHYTQRLFSKPNLVNWVYETS